MVFNFLLKQKTVKINGGACTRPERTYNCSAVQQYQTFRSPGAMVTNCNVSDCYGNYCAELEATPAQGCSLFTSDGLLTKYYAILILIVF